MKTDGGEDGSLTPGAQRAWLVWFGLALVLISTFGCRSDGSREAETVHAVGRVGLSLGVPGLVDLRANPINPFETTNARAIVFIFVETDCPISNRYAPEIQRLFTKYASRGLDFWLVYPAPERSPAEIARHAREFRLSLKVLRDPQHALVKQAGVQVTPEAAVFLRDGSVVYRGRIDDKYAGFGKERPAPTRRDLEEAILAILGGKPILNATTLAVGCYIPALPGSKAP